jgi:hypothetical protein
MRNSVVPTHSVGATAVENSSSNSATRSGCSTVGSVHDFGTHVIALT